MIMHVSTPSEGWALCPLALLSPATRDKLEGLLLLVWLRECLQIESSQGRGVSSKVSTSWHVIWVSAFKIFIFGSIPSHLSLCASHTSWVKVNFTHLKLPFSHTFANRYALLTSQEEKLTLAKVNTSHSSLMPITLLNRSHSQFSYLFGTSDPNI